LGHVFGCKGGRKLKYGPTGNFTGPSQPNQAKSGGISPTFPQQKVHLKKEKCEKEQNGQRGGNVPIQRRGDKNKATGEKNKCQHVLGRRQKKEMVGERKEIRKKPKNANFKKPSVRWGGESKKKNYYKRKMGWLCDKKGSISAVHKGGGPRDWGGKGEGGF